MANRSDYRPYYPRPVVRDAAVSTTCKLMLVLMYMLMHMLMCMLMLMLMRVLMCCDALHVA